MHALLAWGFGVSIALHALIGPILGTYKPPVAESVQISVVSLSRRTAIKLRAPVPTAQPTRPPTPPADRSSRLSRPVAQPSNAMPPATQVHTSLPQARLKIHAYKMTSGSHAASATEEKYRVQTGSEEGVPQGTLASAPAAVPAAGVPGPISPTAVGSSLGTDRPSVVDTPSQLLRTSAPPLCATPNVEARATHLVEPFFPGAARELGSTGDVDVLVSLSANGAVTATSIYRSAGNPALDQAAIRAARETSYSPEIVGCKPIAGEYTFHASFTLDSSKP